VIDDPNEPHAATMRWHRTSHAVGGPAPTIEGRPPMPAPYDPEPAARTGPDTATIAAAYYGCTGRTT